MQASIRSCVILTLVTGLSIGAATAATVVRGPYLQMGTDSEMTVRWRTDTSTDSVVHYGASANNLNQTVTVSGNTTEHEVQISNLSPLTEYFYSVGSSSATLAGGDNSYRFSTSPTPGTAVPTRVWLIGDSGTANASAAAVYNAYLNFSGANNTNLWVMLGDNAYNDGTDSQYQAAVFNIYPELLRRSPLWATLGNHDGHSASSATESGPYYDIFTLPRNGEAGGVASGTEAYYSFDYGNIHFICLDSYDSDRSPNGAMMTWLQNDVAVTDKTWIIAFWHHPPYTKGSHNSDSEGALIDMRQNALPILEDYGVDLVFSGHSHSYERSYMIDGHYGSSGTFSSANQIDGGDGREDGNGAYQKASFAAHDGAVYTVAGSSGKTSGGSLNHPAMFTSLNQLGSVVLDIDGNRLDAKFLNSTGAVADYYTLIKGADTTAPVLNGASAASANSVQVVFSETVDTASAQAIANYAIDSGIVITDASASGNTVTLTTATLTADITYTMTVNNVEDNNGNVIAANSQTTFVYQNIQTTSFQQGVAGYSGTEDTWIGSGVPSSNFGNDISLLADGADGSNGETVSLVKWDVAAIPAASTVTAVQVEFDVFGISGGAYNLYAGNVAWNESAATWNTIDPYNNRGAQIGSFVPSTTGKHTINLNSAGVSLIQDWINGASNGGLFVLSGGTSDGLDMRSSEYGTSSTHPRLVVTYTSGSGNALPIADFTDTSNGLSVAFTDTSTDSDGNVVSWSWEFGDGATSTAQNPSHTYASDGTYTVSLTVTDNDGASDSVSHDVTVAAANNSPIANFTAASNQLTVTLTDTSNDSDGTVVGWQWNFGDGSSSTLQNPIHSYSVSGNYTINLTVTDNDGAIDSSSQIVTLSDGSAAVTLALQQGLGGYNGAEDTYVASGNPNANWGSASAILADGDDGRNDELISLLYWDVSSIPAGGTITDVSITLQVFNRTNNVYKLWEMTSAWNEAAATWANTNPAANAGVKLGSFSPTTNGSYTINLNANGVALVQGWVDGTANNGITIQSGGTRNGVDMRSSEYGTQTQRPKLTITYQ